MRIAPHNPIAVKPGDHHADELRDLQLGLADLLCWCRGYMAAKPEDSNGPLGIEEARILHRYIKSALEDGNG